MDRLRGMSSIFKIVLVLIGILFILIALMVLGTCTLSDPPQCGTILDAGNSQWAGPGGEDILNTDVIVRHAYDASDNGVPKLLISTLNWDSNGWPRY